MSTFEVKVVQITIEDHPNADALELAAVGGFRAVVKKDRFKTGDWVAYAPEASLFPEWLLKQEGFWNEERGKGMMAGSQGNRVKPMKLRGALSEGVIIKPNKVDPSDPSKVFFARFKDDYLADPDAFIDGTGRDTYNESTYIAHIETGIWAKAGEEVSHFFGIQKYEPPVPVHMSGEVDNKHGWAINFDVENAKKHPDVLIPGEDVVITEKLHGTFCQAGYVPEHDMFIIASKGLGSRGLVFKLNDKNQDNLYVRTVSAGDYSLLDKIKDMALRLNRPVYVLGEIFGRGVQDLNYNMQEPTFRAFDMYVGQPQKGQYVDFHQLRENCNQYNIPMVPVLYEGAYSYEIMKDLTDGSETVSGNSANIREGVVVKPIIERRDDMIGRVLLKHVSEKYITRKGNTTEFT